MDTCAVHSPASGRQAVWIVGYDWSQGAEDALQEAVRQAIASKDRVVLWLVSGVDEHHLFEDAQKTHRENLLRADMLRERVSGLYLGDVHTYVREQDPKPLLLEEIHHLDATKCFVGKFGHHASLKDKILGTVGDFLKKESPEWCEIVIV